MLKVMITRTSHITYDGTLLVSEIKDEKDIDVEDIRENVEAARKLAGNDRYLSLVIAAPYSSITYEGRKESDEVNNYHQTIAQAIVVKNLANKIMGNFIIKFHSPPCPCRLFNDRDSAVAWLKTFIDKNGKEKNEPVKVLML